MSMCVCASVLPPQPSMQPQWPSPGSLNSGFAHFFFPSLMSPVSCLSLTPLCEPGVTLPLCPQLPAFSGVCCYPPHLREECVLPNLYFSLACAICNLDFACIKWSLIVPQGCSSLSAFPKNLFPVEAETLNIFPTAQSSPALPAPCTALDAPP